MVERITRTELVEAIDGAAPPVLVEALGAAYFADAHLHGALNIPPDAVHALAPILIPDRDVPIVVYCSGTCQSSLIAAELLVELGYRQVRVYEGGKEDWIEHGLAVERAPSCSEGTRGSEPRGTEPRHDDRDRNDRDQYDRDRNDRD